jgi:hypothetical protein
MKTMTIEQATRLSMYPGAEDTQTFEGIRMDLAKQITKAREENDYRKIVILCRRFTDAFPSSGLVPIEKHVREVFREMLRTAKEHVISKCPVCGGEMHTISCCDDLFRPYCKKCNRTYTPMGYDCEDDFAKKWHAITWDGGSEPSEVIEARS